MQASLQRSAAVDHRSFVAAEPGSPPPSLSDAELLHRIARRSSEALAELYDRHASSLLSMARRMLRQREDAEEVLQEVFIHVWRRAHTYESRRASVTSWLFLITRSRVIDRLRSRRTSERTLAGLLHERPPDKVSPQGAANVLARQRQQRVLEALAGIPDAQRQVLELAFFDGLSHSQIARHLEIPLGTVKTRSVLGMKKLRLELADEIVELI